MFSKTAASFLAWLLVIASAAFAAGNNGNSDARRIGDATQGIASPSPIFDAAPEIHADNGGEQSWELSDSSIDEAPPNPEKLVVTSKSPAVDRVDNIRLDRNANKAIHPGRGTCLPDMHAPGRSSKRPVSGCATPSLAVTMPIPRSPPSPATTLP